MPGMLLDHATRACGFSARTKALVVRGWERGLAAAWLRRLGYALMAQAAAGAIAAGDHRGPVVARSELSIHPLGGLHTRRDGSSVVPTPMRTLREGLCWRIRRKGCSRWWRRQTEGEIAVIHARIDLERLASSTLFRGPGRSHLSQKRRIGQGSTLRFLVTRTFRQILHAWSTNACRTSPRRALFW